MHGVSWSVCALHWIYFLWIHPELLGGFTSKKHVICLAAQIRPLRDRVETQTVWLEGKNAGPEPTDGNSQGLVWARTGGSKDLQ